MEESKISQYVVDERRPDLDYETMSVTSGMSYQSGISTETRYDDQLLSLEKLMTYYKENYNVDIIKNKIEREKSDKKKSWIFGRSKAAAACALC